jgi:hypothetical protein
MAWKTTFIAAFVGKMLATLVIAVLVVFGAGPDEWAAWLIRAMPEFITPSMVRWWLGGLAVLAFMLIWGPSIYRSLASGSPPRNPEMTAWEALTYIIEHSIWGHTQKWEMYRRGGDEWFRGDDAGRRALMVVQAARIFETAAKDGHLAVRGHPTDSSAYEQIDCSFWETSGLDTSEYVRANARRDRVREGNAETRDLLAANAPQYVGLRVNRGQVEQLWTPSSQFDQLILANMGIPHG